MSINLLKKKGVFPNLSLIFILIFNISNADDNCTCDGYWDLTKHYEQVWTHGLYYERFWKPSGISQGAIPYTDADNPPQNIILCEGNLAYTRKVSIQYDLSPIVDIYENELVYVERHWLQGPRTFKELYCRPCNQPLKDYPDLDENQSTAFT